MTTLTQLLAVARGDAAADTLLVNARVVDVFNGSIESADIALFGDQIAGVGHGYRAANVIDLGGALVSPGLIDAHVHIESSLCVPSQFAEAVVPRGVTTVMADPHEIANVAGPAGVRFMAEAARGSPLNVHLMAPSCVPPTPMATSGGRLAAADIQALCDEGLVHGLGEAMNYPGVMNGDADVLAILAAAGARPIDGHCPGLSGPALSAYVAAGVGSDHECVTVDEAREKLSRGLYILIREATNARNLDALLPLITPSNSRRICFCTDDRTPGDLLNVGTIDHMIRRAIDYGIDPIDAFRMATLNTAEWFGLKDQGAIAPGRLANLMVFDDLKRPSARLVVSRGKLVARDGKSLAAVAQQGSRPALGRCDVQVSADRLVVRAVSGQMRVIGCRPDQLVTDHRILPVKSIEGRAVADPSADVLKMAVWERHRGTGNVGVGFIQGLALKRGALAGTVAHDHHNLVTIGADDRSMLTATAAVAKMGGGLAVAVGDEVLASLPLPVGGLMSDRPVAEVAAAYDRVIGAAKSLGSPLADPFMAMSFMALEVIPSLKLTDQGLVDVEQFKIVSLFV